MKTYIVGGAVRDGLLGLPVQDRDHVVVGATTEAMLAQGYTPVGKDFPVFLHPVTHEEYALARTERKTAPGYKGFVFHAAPEVTLEDDLIRRDLTINAIAQADDGSLIDPFGGRADLQEKIFRHVSPAFAEDPLRILRVARFAARFTDFTVAPETNVLMRQMVAAGEVDALVPERVWQELARGLMEEKPSRMFDVLRACSALARILPEVDMLWNVDIAQGRQTAATVGDDLMRIIDVAAARGHSLPIRFGVLMHDLGDGGDLKSISEAPVHASQAGDGSHEKSRVAAVDAVCKRLKVPRDCNDVARMTARELASVACACELSPASIVALLERCDAFRKPLRFRDMLHAAQCIHLPPGASLASTFAQAEYLSGALAAAQAVDSGKLASDVARRYPNQPQRIAAAIRDARIAAVGAACAGKGIACKN